MELIVRQSFYYLIVPWSAGGAVIGGSSITNVSRVIFLWEEAKNNGSLI